ncbi:MAG: winged helix-turn-helix transcriptional regulator [Phycisphaerae bacterium]|nr:winged helix-turn-helix transcriptional regulator [Phycisphaerae bacterium]
MPLDKQAKKLYEMKAQVLAAAAHPIRLAIIDFLRDSERCVCDISAHLAAGRSNVSRHLGVMLKAGVLDCRKDGLKMFYRLKTPCLVGFLNCVTEVLRKRIEQDKAALARL